MNILIFSWRGVGHPNAGGAEIATHEHAKAWVRIGHCVTVFSSHYKGCKKMELVDGVQIIRKGRQFVGVQIAGIIWYLFGRHNKYDIVVDQFHGIPFFTPLFVKSKILAYIHEVAIEVWKTNELPRPYNLIAAFVGPIVEPIIFKLYKKIDFMTVSNSTKRDLVSFGIAKERIRVIQNGFEKVKINLKKKEKRVVYLGALSRDKGVDDAIEIFSHIVDKDEGWRMSIVGKGKGFVVKALRDKSKKLKLSDAVKFEGFVSERKKYEVLSRSFCLINPSIHEGWGLVNIEANSVGTPVFAYKVKGITDSVVDKQTGMLFEKGDIHGIAMGIVKLYADKKRHDEMSKNCIKWSERFSWEKSTAESLKLIESI